MKSKVMTSEFGRHEREHLACLIKTRLAIQTAEYEGGFYG